MTSPSQSHVAGTDSLQGGTILASLLVSTLGLAVVVPGLLLQGVVGQSRASNQASDGHDRHGVPTSIPAGGGRGAREAVTADVEVDGRNGTDSPVTAVAEDGQAAPADPSPRGRGVPPGQRGETVTVDDVAAPPNGQREPGSGFERGRPGRSDQVVPAIPTASVTVIEPGEAGLVAVSETSDAREQSEGEARQPVTFAEVQAAHTAAAHSFRDLRKSLNEAYRIIGRLNVERYEALAELAELKGLPPPERPPERSWNAAARPSALSPSRPAAPAAARRVKRPKDLAEAEEIDEAEVKTLARRRQRIVLSVIVVGFVFALTYRLLDWRWFPNLTDPRALSNMAGIGILMQMLFLAFFLVRLTTLTGKGRSWLFPTPEEEALKRRRKRVRGR